VNSIFSLTARAELKMPQVLSHLRCHAAGKPAIHARRSKTNPANSRTADLRTFLPEASAAQHEIPIPAVHSMPNRQNPIRPFAAPVCDGGFRSRGADGLLLELMVSTSSPMFLPSHATSNDRLCLSAR